MATAESSRLPLHVLTGFLGSGKTALLRALLARTRARIAVLVNEVGELGIDHHLLERIDEDVLALPGGCLCCAVRDELHASLRRIRALGVDRVVLETTGLADPAPLLHGIGADPSLAQTMQLAGVIAVVDCLRAEDLYATQPEMRRQLDFADRVVLTKADLAPDRAAAVHAWLEGEVPGREVRIASNGDVDPEWLLAAPGFARSGGDPDHGALGWVRSGVVDGRGEDASRHVPFTTHVVRSEVPVDVDALQLWLRLVTQVDGDRLLRIKGVVRCAATGACYALQAAGRAVSPAQRIAVAPSDLGGAEAVIVERGMPTAVMSRLLDSLRSALATVSLGRST